MKNTRLAANGTDVGSGYDVEIRRTGRTSAIACVTNLATKDEWMQELEPEPEEDLQSLAVKIGNCPGLGSDGWIKDTDWDTEILAQWNSAAPDADGQQD